MDLDTISFTFPVNISLVPVLDPKTRRPTLAEQMTFESLPGFLYMDLYKGMPPEICPGAALTAAGGSWRWADTIPATAIGCAWHQRKDLPEGGRHEREKEKQKTETAAREYNRTYNRLKARKRRGRSPWTSGTGRWCRPRS